MKYPHSLFIFFVLVFSFQSTSYAQMRKVNGLIIDAQSKLPLYGATIVWGNQQGAVADSLGKFQIKIHQNVQQIQAAYLGYFSKTFYLSGKNDTTIVLELKPSFSYLSQIVITAERAPIRPEQATAKIEVLSAKLIDQVNANTASDLLDRVAGVSVQNGQVSIRGGSAFANGVGSRVMLLLDGMPLLSPDLGDIRWNFVPIEAIEQVEVIKGAGSALYGSQAINGIINIKTLQASDKPSTQVRTWAGIYSNPRSPHIRQNALQPPWQAGTSFFHAQKINQVALRAHGLFLEDKGYRVGEYNRRLRLGLSANYVFEQVEGLSAGLILLGQIDSAGIFYVWQNDTLAYNPYPGTAGEEFFRYYMADAFVKLERANWKHLWQHRILEAGNLTNFSEYQTQYKPQIAWAQQTTFSAGAVLQHYLIRSPNLQSTHSAVYLQTDQDFGKLRYAAGFRLEQYTLAKSVHSINPDIERKTISPVFRFGINYNPYPNHIFWVNWGQGFRNPSLVERFAQTEGSGLVIAPSPFLLPEKAYTTEIGYRYLLKNKNFKINAEIAAFLMQYQEMIEFQLQGVVLNNELRPGFNAQNTGAAQITGLEPELQFTYQKQKQTLQLAIAYTYMNPIAENDILNARPQAPRVLFYRSRHLFRADLNYQFSHFVLALNSRFNSNIINYDVILDRISGLGPNDPRLGIETFLQNNPHGLWLHDASIGYKTNNGLQFQFVCRNLTNTAAMILPGNMANTRTLILRLGLNL